MDNHNNRNNNRSNDHNDRNSRDNQNEGHPLLGQTLLHSVLGGLFARQHSNGPAHDQGSGPSLNAYSAPPSDSFFPPSHHDDIHMAGLFSHSLYISDIYHQPQESEDLPTSPQVPSTSSDAGPTQSDSGPSTASHPATQHRVHSHTNLPDLELYDMPELEDSSDSEEVEVDVEMADVDDPPLPDLSSNPPYPGNIILPSSSATTPPISSPPSPPGSAPPTHPPSRLARRARVEEDEDPEDFRETNRQRRHSPSFIDTDHLHAPIPPVNPTQPTPNQNRPPLHARHRFVLGGDSGLGRVVFDIVVGPGIPPPTQGGQQPTQDPQHHVHDEHNDNGPDGLMFFDFPLGAVGDLGDPLPGAQEEADGRIPPTTDGEVPPPGFVEMLLGMFGGVGMGGFGFGEEEDDPERAKKLLDGLDVVDEGLVKRLERVGFGGDGKDGSAEPGPVNCAVCWEGLLEEVPDEENMLSSDSSENESRPQSDVDTASTPPPPSFEAVASSSELPLPKTHKRKIVTLPCSHAFHAECLLPWFTRPHRTTCPTCRFDIDPESLTYVPRPRRLRTANPAAAPAGAAEVPRPQGTAAHEGRRDQPIIGGIINGPPTAATTTTATVPPIGISLLGLTGANVAPNLPNANAPGQAQPNTPGADVPFYLALDISMFMPLRPPGGTPTTLDVGSQTQPLGTQTQPQITPIGPHTPSQQPVGPAPPTSGAQASPPVGNQVPPRTAQLFGLGGLPNVAMGLINIPLGLGTGRGRSQTGVTLPRQAGTNPTATNRATTVQPATGPLPTTVPNPPPTGANPTSNTNQPNQPLPGQGLGGFLSHVLQQVVQAAARSGFNLGNPGAQQQGAAQPQQAGPQPQDAATVPPGAQPTWAQPPPEPRHQAQPAHDAPPLNFFELFGAGIGGAGGLAPTPGTNPTNEDQQPFPLGAGLFAAPPPNPYRRSTNGRRAPNAPKPQWTLPPPPGLTLHERVEKRERELGLRCSDMSCGLGPTDEDPIPVSDVGSIRQVGIRPLKEKVADGGKGKERKIGAVGLPENEASHGKGEFVCEHQFHPACLVVSERVAGWGGEGVVKEEKTGDEEVGVSCPVCRAVGCVTKDEWDEGASLA